MKRRSQYCSSRFSFPRSIWMSLRLLGTSKRLCWRKVHFGVDAGSDEIVAFDPSVKEYAGR
jgi:hypothetical protein